MVPALLQAKSLLLLSLVFLCDHVTVPLNPPVNRWLWYQILSSCDLFKGVHLLLSLSSFIPLSQAVLLLSSPLRLCFQCICSLLASLNTPWLPFSLVLAAFRPLLKHSFRGESNELQYVVLKNVFLFFL